MKKYKVGIIGGTGMVGQRFVTLMEDHPWFQLTAIAASPRSAGKTYEQAVSGRWAMKTPIPQQAKDLVVLDASADVEKIAGMVDFVFCAVDMKKEEIRALEETYAKAEVPVVSNNSAHRWTDDVPMVVPEMNPEHLAVIPAQRARLGTRRGFIAVKSNCSIQSYAPALHPLMQFGIEKVLVCTYQAISGAGKTFERWPEMVDNLIPYIGGEEEKSEQEPLKVGSPSPTATPPPCSSPSAISPLWRRAGRPGRTSRAGPRSWSSPPPPSSSSTILRSPTVPRPDWTGIWRAAWPSPWAVCAPIPSTTTSSWACPTTPCAAPPAAPSCWPSCCARKGIFNG